MKKDVTNKIVADSNLAIEIRHFTKKFKDFKAVNNIEMIVSKWKIHGFIGPNGSGKTTTIKSIIGAIISIEGKLFIHGMKSVLPLPPNELLVTFRKMLVFQSI